MVDFGILYSTGKDSHLALCKALSFYKTFDILINLPENPFDVYFQQVPEEVVVLHEKAWGKEFIKVREENYEVALRKLLRSTKAKLILSGVLYSAFQNRVLNEVAFDLGKEVASPNWLVGLEDYIPQYKSCGIKAIVTKVSAYGLGMEDVGKEVTEMFDKPNKNPLGEGGEYDSLVLESKIMPKKMVLKGIEKARCGEYCYYAKKLYLSLENKAIERVNIKFHFFDKSRVLVIGLHNKPIHFYEFSLPLIRIFKANYVNLENLGSINPRKFDLVILSGTSLMDFSYMDKQEIYDFLSEFKGKVLGICAGFQVLAKFLGLKLRKEKKPLIGLRLVDFMGYKSKQWFLTSYTLSDGASKEIRDESGKPVGFMEDRYLGLAFHPEYRLVALRDKTFLERLRRVLGVYI